jgi:PEP-CTERM motif
MSLVLSLALAASSAMTPVTASLPSCSWDRPGHRAFMGDVVAAVDRYQDIPAVVRERLKARMAARRYDDIARIGRDTIAGRYSYTNELRDMHFGEGQVCARVTRERWTADAHERGLVYCDSGHCIIVPTVCRNVARVTRLPDRVAAADAEDSAGLLARSKPGTGGGPGGASVGPSSAAGELRFDPPAAGPSATAGPVSSLGTAAPASFEQLGPGAAVTVTPSTLAMPEVVAAASTLEPVAAAIARATGNEAVVPGPAITPGVAAVGTPGSLGNLDNVLPVIAWTTPFGPGPAPSLPRDTQAPAQPVPEADTWAMWLAGLGAVVFMARRRRR